MAYIPTYLVSFLFAALGVLATFWWSRPRRSRFDPWVGVPGLVGIYIDEDDRIIATQYSFDLGEQRILCQGRLMWQADKAAVEIAPGDEDIPTVRQVNVWSSLQADSKQTGTALGHALRAVAHNLGTIPQPMHVGLVLPATVDALVHESVVRTAQEALICLSVHVFSMGPALALSLRIPKPGSRGPRSTLVLAASGSVSVLEGSGDELPPRESTYIPPASAHAALADLLVSSQEIAQVLKLEKYMTLPVEDSFAPYVYNLTVADVARGGAIAARHKAEPVFLAYGRLGTPVSIVLGDTAHGLTHILLGPDQKAGAVRIVPATMQTRLRVQIVLGDRPRPADNIPLGEVVLDRPQVTHDTAQADVSPVWSSPVVCATARWTGKGVFLLVQVIDIVQRQRTAVELPFGPWAEEGLPRDEAIRFAQERFDKLRRLSDAAVRYMNDDDMEREQRYRAMKRGQWSLEAAQGHIVLGPGEALRSNT